MGLLISIPWEKSNKNSVMFITAETNFSLFLGTRQVAWKWNYFLSAFMLYHIACIVWIREVTYFFTRYLGPIETVFDLYLSDYAGYFDSNLLCACRDGLTFDVDNKHQTKTYVLQHPAAATPLPALLPYYYFLLTFSPFKSFVKRCASDPACCVSMRNSFGNRVAIDAYWCRSKFDHWQALHTFIS